MRDQGIDSLCSCKNFDSTLPSWKIRLQLCNVDQVSSRVHYKTCSVHFTFYGLIVPFKNLKSFMQEEKCGEISLIDSIIHCVGRNPHDHIVKGVVYY